MNPKSNMHWMPRVRRDIKDCVKFIRRQPLGRPFERAQDIYRWIELAVAWPLLRPVGAFRASSGLELRCRHTAQFVIVYAYVPPGSEGKCGVVSIRAVKHRRVKNVFSGVREPEPA